MMLKTKSMRSALALLVALTLVTGAAFALITSALTISGEVALAPQVDELVLWTSATVGADDVPITTVATPYDTIIWNVEFTAVGGGSQVLTATATNQSGTTANITTTGLTVTPIGVASALSLADLGLTVEVTTALPATIVAAGSGDAVITATWLGWYDTLSNPLGVPVPAAFRVAHDTTPGFDDPIPAVEFAITFNAAP